MKFTEMIDTHSFILTEGSITERLRRHPEVTLDPYINHAGLLYGENKHIIADIYRQYMDVGKSYAFPIITLTPTRRANPELLKKAGYGDEVDVNGDCVRFLSRIRDEYGRYSKQIYIGGLIGCKGDAYTTGEALTAKEARLFHKFQLQALSRSGVDFLIAETLPAADEALGIAMAMSGFDLPYILSFVLNADGTLLDGSPLHDVIARIDGESNPRPFCYFANCIHPTRFKSALSAQRIFSETVIKRVIGLQGNTSCKSPEELESLPYLDSQEPEPFANEMWALKEMFGTKVLGGCCGTDHRHIAAIARKATPL
jgi:homocysteine S-methyltransferase